jgi:hypothetical protein
MSVAEASQFVIVMLAPTLLAGGILVVPRAVRAARRRTRRRRADDLLQPVCPPIEQLAADLRRLLRRHEATKQSTYLAMRARHLQAIEAAIGDCAMEAAQALGVASPDQLASRQRTPLSTPELRRLLRALADAGLILVAAPGLMAADGFS